MNSLLDYYRMKKDTDTDTIYFQRVKEEDIKICGKSLNEVITILNGLELENKKKLIIYAILRIFFPP